MKANKDPVQEQLIAARRNQILDAAAAVFVQKGFHPATIKDIAREAGIADGTIYNYFKNKPALLLGIFNRMQDSVLQSIDPAALAGADLRTQMRAYLWQPLMGLSTDNFALFRIVVSEMMVNQDIRARYQQQILAPTLALAEQQFQQWADQGLIKPVDIRLTVRAVSGLMLGLIIQYILQDTTQDAAQDPIQGKTLAEHWDDLPDLLTDLLLDGIAAA